MDWRQLLTWAVAAVGAVSDVHRRAGGRGHGALTTRLLLAWAPLPQQQQPQPEFAFGAFLAPEQTGRLEDSVPDVQTDLYSLGVIFFHVFSGTLPFHGESTIDYLSAHVSLAPPPLGSVVRDCPPAISRLVDKLLQKNKPDRYQSLAAVEAELRRILVDYSSDSAASTQLSTTTTTTTRPQLHLADELYGNAKEIAEQLLLCLQLPGAATTVFHIIGHSGQGKSSVLERTRLRLALDGNRWLGVARFQPQCESQEAQLLAMMRALVAAASVSSPVAEWRRCARLLPPPGVQPLLPMIPEIGWLLDADGVGDDGGRSAPFPKDDDDDDDGGDDDSNHSAAARTQVLTGSTHSQEERNRIVLAFAALLEMFLLQVHAPIVLFLDDLQFADDASLALVHLMVGTAKRHGGSGLALVAAYRGEHPPDVERCQAALGSDDATLSHVLHRLRPLSMLDVVTLLQAAGLEGGGDANALGADATLVELAQLMVLQTQGNAFFCRQLLLDLVRRDLIEPAAAETADPGSRRWRFDIARIRMDLMTPRSLADWLQRQIVGSSQPHLIVVLAAASCCGRRFLPEQIATVLAISTIQAEAALQSAATTFGLVQHESALPPPGCDLEQRASPAASSRSRNAAAYCGDDAQEVFALYNATTHGLTSSSPSPPSSSSLTLWSFAHDSVLKAASTLQPAATLAQWHLAFLRLWWAVLQRHQDARRARTLILHRIMLHARDARHAMESPRDDPLRFSLAAACRQMMHRSGTDASIIAEHGQLGALLLTPLLLSVAEDNNNNKNNRDAVEQLEFELQLERASALCYCGGIGIEQAEAALVQLRQHRVAQQRRAALCRVMAAHVLVYVMRADYDGCITFGTDCLHLLGLTDLVIDPPPEVTERELARLQAHLVHGLPTANEMRVTHDDFAEALLELFDRLIQSAFYRGTATALLFWTRMVNLSLELGCSISTPVGLVWLGWLLAYGKDWRQTDEAQLRVGYSLGQLALQLIDAHPEWEAMRGRVQFINAFGLYWLRHSAEQMCDEIRAATDRCLAHGDINYAAYCGFHLVTTLWNFHGATLPALLEICQRYLPLAEQIGRDPEHLLLVYRNLFSALAAAAAAAAPSNASVAHQMLFDADLERRVVACHSDNAQVAPLFYACQAAGLYLLSGGDNDGGGDGNSQPTRLAWISSCRSLELSRPGRFAALCSTMSAGFFHALLMLRRAHGNSSESPLRDQIAQEIATWRRWAEMAPHMLEHRYQILLAEYHFRVLGDTGAHTEQLFQQARQQCAVRGMVRDGLICERLYVAFGRQRLGALAIGWWGTPAASAVESQAPLLVNSLSPPQQRQSPRPPSATATSSPATRVQDAETSQLLQVAHDLAEETELSTLLERLLRVMLRFSGAERVVLVMARIRDDEALGEAAADDGHDDADNVSSLALDQFAQIVTSLSGVHYDGARKPLGQCSRSLPTKLIRSCFGRRQSVALSDADVTRSAHYHQLDPYFAAAAAAAAAAAKAHVSFQCLFLQGRAQQRLQPRRALGVLYLENWQTHGIFRKRHPGVAALAAQLSVALETAALIDHLRCVTLDVKRQSDELARSNQLKDAFLANASHELRTPLNAVIGLTELVLAQATTLPQQQRQDMETVQESGRALLQLVDDLLDMAKIEANKIAIVAEWFSLSRTIETCLEQVEPLANRNRLHLVMCWPAASDVNSWLALDGRILADRQRLQQVLLNLLSNAIKFSPEHGHVSVRVGVEQPQDGEQRARLCVAVDDEGLGISAEDIARLFEKFVQLDGGTNRRYGGSGLGLAISKQLCLLMGGDISCCSQPGRGSTFRFWLPVLAERDEPTLPPPSSSAAAIVVVRICIGDGQLRESVTNLLQHTKSHRGFSLTLEPSDVASSTGVSGSQERITLSDKRTENASSSEHLFLAPRWACDQPSSGWHRVPFRRAALLDNIVAAGGAASPISASSSSSSSSSSFSVSPVLSLAEAGSSLRFLVIEDNEVNQRVLKRVLEAIFVQQTTATEIVCLSSGLAALPLFEQQQQQQQRFDIIFMDIQMPELDGIETTRRLRQAGLQTPIVAVSASVTAEVKSSCQQAGVNDFVSKPIQRLQLQRLLQAILSRRAPVGAEGKS